MKILWHSNAPWAATGYGQQTATFVPRFQAAGHDVAVSAFYGLEGNTKVIDGLTIYPSDHTRFGKFMLRDYATLHAGGDLRDVQVVTLMDVWPLTNTKYGLPLDTNGMRLACWTPIDHLPVPPGVVEALTITKATPIAMSRFGEDALRACGFDPLYVPHGIDTNVYQPLDRDEVREALRIPADAFVVTMVANNQGNAPPRKAFPQVFFAFAEFQRRHPEALLYLHTDVYGFGEGLNLIALADLCGIPTSALAATDRSQYHNGVAPAALAGIYSMSDVLANPSYGEGFGIPIIESQACGTPVIVTNWTAMPELCGAGWIVDGDQYYDPSQGACYMYAPICGILDALESAYAARGDQALRDRAREFALAYDADRVMEKYWAPVLGRLDAPLEVGPLPNRARRRAAKRAGVAA